MGQLSESSTSAKLPGRIDVTTDTVPSFYWPMKRGVITLGGESLRGAAYTGGRAS